MLRTGCCQIDKVGLRKFNRILADLPASSERGNLDEAMPKDRISYKEFDSHSRPCGRGLRVIFALGMSHVRNRPCATSRLAGKPSGKYRSWLCPVTSIQIKLKIIAKMIAINVKTIQIES